MYFKNPIIQYFSLTLITVTLFIICGVKNSYATDNSTDTFEFVTGNIFSEGNNSFKTLAVDKSSKTAYLFQIENDMPKIIKVYKNILTGEINGDKQVEGDKKTPEGIYFTQNFISRNNLPPTYGYGALPLNYPNFYDKILGKTGHGIWVHGVQEGVEDNSTEGCVALDNGDMEDLVSKNALNIPVIISEKLSFLDKDSYVIAKNYWLNYINGFIKAWENNDFEKFQQYIHTKFTNSDNQDYFKYVMEKKQLMKLYPYRKINIDNIQIFVENDSEAFVNFNQMYCANNILVEGNKKIYISKELGEHKIIGELFYPSGSYTITEKLAKKFIKDWIAAWESKDIDKYKQFYNEKFASAGMNFDKWMEDKYAKFQKYQKITVTVDNISMENITPTEITISFKQKFSADTYSDYGIKVIRLSGCPGDFKIISETWRPL
ncbi:L,D-transpeptidase family protein [Deferribacteraceae bacterium V6Fe1]|nr:L,D-transpeptidase family protein [Deferribacteraceae bacterium V6Fe1]